MRAAQQVIQDSRRESAGLNLDEKHVIYENKEQKVPKKDSQMPLE